MLIVDRRRRAGEIVDFIDLDKERERDVVAHELEIGMVEKMRNIVLAAGEEIIDAQHVAALLEQAVDEVRSEEAGAAGHHHAFTQIIRPGHQQLRPERPATARFTCASLINTPARIR